MNIRAITVVIWFGLVTSGAAQSRPSGKPGNTDAPPKAQLSEIRSLVQELEGRNEKLHELNAQYRSHLEERPQAQDQLAKWNAALERLLRRIDAARVAVVETMQRLDQAARGALPTSLAKDFANARNEAEAQRTAAEHALAKNKSKPTRTTKQAPPKQPAEKTPPPSLDDDL